jgi:4-hydroxy-tetrahydrodipicolinate reductase
MTSPAPRIAIIGGGKMGTAIAELARARQWPVSAIIGAADNAGGAGISAATLGGADVALEFTEPDAAPANVLACARAGVPVVVGTTGWRDRFDEVAAEVTASGGAMLWAANFSVGVNLFYALAEAAGRVLARSGFDAAIVETHHAAKKDAPSGTAAAIEQLLSAGLGRPVPITSIRTGSVPGTHEIVFDAPFEQVRLVHEARDRRVFADGALRAAEWIRGRRGIFTMRDVLALHDGATR